MSLIREVPFASSTPSLGSQLFESSPDCVKLLDLAGNVIAMNRNGRCVMEIDDFNLVAGKPWKSLWPASSQKNIEQAVAAASIGQTGHFRAFCPTAKGTPKWWDVIVTGVQGQSGNIEKLLAVSRDITSIHRASLELQESEARFRSLVTATSAIVWNGPASATFTSEQPSWAAFTGQTFEEYRGWGWLNAVHPDDRDRTAALWKQASATESLYATEHRLRRHDGEYRHMSARAVPLVDDQGTIYEWVGVHTDITDSIHSRLERESLLRQIQAANDRLADVFQQAPAFMCVLRGPDHVFELTNDRYLRLVGDRNPIGQTVRQALPEVAGQGFFELLDRVYQTGEPFIGNDMAIMLARTSEESLEKRIVDFAYLALRDADGEITGVLAHGVDQTERKRAESDLYDSRERLQKIISQAATGVVEADAEGRITLVNQKYCDMVGYSEADLLGTRVLDVTAPDSIQITREAINRLAAGGSDITIEKQYRRKNGTLMWATSSVGAIRDQAGNFIGIVAIVIDITEIKQNHEALRSSEERYRTLFESMDQGYCVIDMIFDDAGVPVDYRFLEMNRMFEEHTGLVDVTNKTARELVPDLERFWFETYGNVALTGKPVRFEHQALALQRWFEVHATKMGGRDSRKVALLFRDITSRKNADDALQKHAARQAFQLDLAGQLREHAEPDAVVQAASALLGKHIGATRAFYSEVDDVRKTFYVRNDWVAKGMSSIAGEVRQLADFGPRITETLYAGDTIIVNDVAEDPRSSGHAQAYEKIDVRAYLAIPLVKAGRLIAVLSVHDSVPHRWTDQERAFAEHTLEQTWAALEKAYEEKRRLQVEAELHESNRRKDDFLAMLAHELRNPLAPIGVAAELLQMKTADADYVQKTSEIIGRQVEHMTHLIDDLLDVSRVTRGLVELDKTHLDITDIVTDAVEQVTPLFRSRGHEFALRLAPENATVHGDKKRLVQVLANILNNAAKYTPDGGKILLTTQVQDDYVQIEVIDNGAGMSPELIKRAFDLFEQAERTPDRSSGGLGLGLPIVKSLVELHGGTVTAASAGVGSGSTLCIRLPRLPEAGKVVSRLRSGGPLAAAATPLRVMVVDDNKDAASMLQMFLQASGHDVSVEHNARRALERARVETPQVFLLDIGLPEMDGNRLAQTLRAQPENAHAVLIAVTGYGQEQDRQRTLAAGFDHHLVKPVDIRMLADIFSKIRCSS